MTAKRRSAFTLIELIMAIVVLGVCAGAMAFWVVQGNAQRVSSHELKLASDLADRYMAEIVATGRWDEQSGRAPGATGAIPLQAASIGPEESSRGDYDDCDDYDGFSAAGSHSGKNGEDWGEQFRAFAVSAQVRFVDFTNLEPSASPTNLKQIDVEVTWRNQNKTQLSTLLANV